MKRPDALVILSGDALSTVSLFLQPEPERVAGWRLIALDNRARRHHARAITLAAETLGLVRLVDDHLPALGSDPVGRSTLLMTAGLIAARLGAGRVVDPVLSGGDLDVMAAEVERAHLVEDLLARDGRRVAFDQPLLDLTLTDVALLAIDLAIPEALMRLCDDPESDVGCGRCAGCRSWSGALAAVRSSAAVAGNLSADTC